MPPLRLKKGFFRDPADRVVVLHGVNYSQERKRPPFFDWQTPEHFEALRGWGFNVVRYLISWDSIEPERGVIDTAALDEIERGVRYAFENRIYVLLDMHQDLFSPLFGGNGMPEWSALDDPAIANLRKSGDWFLHYANEDVSRSFDRFYTDEELQDAFAAAWIRVVERVKRWPNVIGYDLVNEPWNGTFAPAKFEVSRLLPFYDRLIRRIRTADPDRAIFVEPSPLPCNAGLPSRLPAPEDRNVVFAPHYYDPWMKARKPYDGGRLRVNFALGFQKKKAVEWKSAVFLGEFGANVEQEGALDYLEDIVAVADSMNFAGWTFWNYYPKPFKHWHNHNIVDREGNGHPVLDRILRPRAAGLTGVPVKQQFDFKSRSYRLKWRGGTGVSHIFVPSRHYPNGFRVDFSEGTWNYDSGTQILEVEVVGESPSGKDGLHELTITP